MGPRDIPELKWVSDLMAMTQVSLAAYAIGGAFVSLAYFDFPYHLVAIVIVSKAYVQTYVPEETAIEPAIAAEPAPAV